MKNRNKTEKKIKSIILTVVDQVDNSRLNSSVLSGVNLSLMYIVFGLWNAYDVLHDYSLWITTYARSLQFGIAPSSVQIEIKTHQTGGSQQTSF